MTASLRWHGLGVHARQEKAAAQDLSRRGFEVFLPTTTERRIWSDRIQDVEHALFPGYLFLRCELSAKRRVEALKARGVFDLVGKLPGDARIARAIPDWEIESLRSLVDVGRALDPVSRLVRGTVVEVGAGPLKGARGIVEEAADGRRRLVVQVALLGRGVRCQLHADDVVLAAEAPRAVA